MASRTPGGRGGSIPLTKDMKLRLGNQWSARASVAKPGDAVLSAGGAGASPADALGLFEPAAPAVILHDAAATPSAVLGQPTEGALEFQPAERAAYVLMQTVETADGLIYDFTLPQQPAGDDGAVLGGPDTLTFPINPVALGGAGGDGAVLGVGDILGGIVGSELGGVIVKRAVQVLKSPFDSALHESIRKAEGEPWAGVLWDPAQSFAPIQGFEGWRMLLKPGQQHRVLLFIHGFGSMLGGPGTNEWFTQLGQQYDAIIGYDHPTIWCDPEHNARELLAMVPDDMQLSVDVVAHSRGGLVARSLVELIEPQPKLNIRRLITNGTPHGGTRLADPERWDRLVSLGMTAASVLAAPAGGLVWVPRILELVLKAASQVVFDLPGIGAMTPGGEFITKLNAAAREGSIIAQAQDRVRYSVVSSRYTSGGLASPTMQQAFASFAAQTFFDKPNDLVVPTESMSQLDETGLVPRSRRLQLDNDHFGYFNSEKALAFMAQQLAD